MEAATHWLTDAEARALAAEKQRDEAEARAAALEDRLGKVEQVIQEQQDAIEEMHQAWLAAKGGGGGGYAGAGGGCQEEILQLQAEVEELHRQLAHSGAANGSPTSRQAFALRAEQAEGRTDALERKVEQLLAHAEEREQQLRMLGGAASQVVSQTKRINELEGLCFDREQQIAKLQVVAAGVEAAKVEKQVAETEKRSLLKRAMDAESKILETEEKARQEAANLASTQEAEKESLRRHFTEEFSKEYSSLNDRFEKEYTAIRQRMAQAELEVRAAEQKAMAEAQQREAALKKMEEAQALQKQKSEAEVGKGADQRLKRLSNHELQALQQRLNAAEARASAAEAKRRDCEQELATAKQDVEKSTEESREALRERAQAVEAFEATRVAREGEMVEASRRVSTLAQLQAERDSLRRQLASQKMSFERELEDFRAEMKICEEALAAGGTQVRPGVDRSRRSTATIGGGSTTSPIAYTPQNRSVLQAVASTNAGRSPSLSPLRVRQQVMSGAASLTVPSVEVQTVKAGVAVATGSSTPPGSSRFEMPPTGPPLTPMSLSNRSRRISATGPVASATSSASAPVATVQSTTRIVTAGGVPLTAQATPVVAKPLLC